MSSPTRRKQLRSRITAIWLSVLSWMHWRRRREALRIQQEELLLVRLQVTLQELVRQELLEMARPLAEALQRLDHNQQLTRSRVQEMQAQQVEMRSQQEQLLLEILQGQQPTALTQLSPLIGLPLPVTSFPSSAS